MLATPFPYQRATQRPDAHLKDLPDEVRAPVLLLESLLSQALAGDAAAVNPILDLRTALATGAPAQEIVACCRRARPGMERICYLACYRVRRLVEARFGIEL